MYDYIKGKLTVKALDYACIDVMGLGYLCHIPFKTYEALNPLNEEEKLFIVMNVKEDDISLYGFKTEEERKLFKLITSVSGIGPKIALAILSVFTPSEIATIIHAEDHKYLSKVNGLGIKKAQKLIIEIKDKIPHGLEKDKSMFDIEIKKNELILGLESLGYNKFKIESFVSDEEILEKSVSELMKTILIKISKLK